jgi:uncharacterized protein
VARPGCNYFRSTVEKDTYESITHFLRDGSIDMSMDEVTVHIGTLYVGLFIPEAQSLKGKRGVVKGLKERLRAKFNASVAELDGHDKWQVATLGIAVIGRDRRQVDSSLQHVLLFIQSCHTVEITAQRIEFC